MSWKLKIFCRDFFTQPRWPDPEKKMPTYSFWSHLCFSLHFCVLLVILTWAAMISAWFLSLPGISKTSACLHSCLLSSSPQLCDIIDYVRFFTLSFPPHKRWLLLCRFTNRIWLHWEWPLNPRRPFPFNWSQSHLLLNQSVLESFLPYKSGIISWFISITCFISALLSNFLPIFMALCGTRMALSHCLFLCISVSSMCFNSTEI